MSWVRLTAVVVSVLLTIGCAQRSKKATTAPSPHSTADELVRQGCYDCLLDARATYERLTVQNAASRLVEINLLIALREKELALDASAALERARAAAAKLPAAAGADAAIAVVAATAPDAAGTPLRDRTIPPFLLRPAEAATAVAAVDASAFSPLLKAYVKSSISCRPTSPGGSAPIPAEATEPILVYRRAVCDGPVDADALRKLRSEVPRFVETSLFLGRAAMARFFDSDGRTARELFEEALKRFPDSSAITFNLGTVLQARSDCRQANEFFTRTLALRSRHEGARLGRAICRTYVSENEGAIADATVLIDEKAPNMADAFYWRAWNRRHRGEIELARADIDRARALRYNARVLTLAGMIEYDQKQFDPAREDLQRATDLDPRECDAPRYLGLVEFSVEAWAPSAKGFAAAADCYGRLITETEAQRAAMAARDDVSEEFRARQLAGFDAAIADDSVQRSAAELNAAINYGRAGDLPNATIYMKRAASDPQRRLAVEDLRQVLGVPRW